MSTFNKIILLECYEILLFHASFVIFQWNSYFVHFVWLNYSLVLLRVPDEWMVAADEWRGVLEVRRKDRRVVDVAVGKSDCKAPSLLSPIYVFQEVHPCLSSHFPPLLVSLPFPPPVTQLSSSTCSTLSLSLCLSVTSLPPSLPLTLTLPPPLSLLLCLFLLGQ